MSENGRKKGLTTRLGYDMIKNTPCTGKDFGVQRTSSELPKAVRLGVVKVSTGTVKPVKHVEFAYTLQKGHFKIKRRQ